jgi:hypothetical protein
MLSHDSAQVIERINTFYGWRAIGRIKILQKPVLVKQPVRKKPLRDLTQTEEQQLEARLEGVENDRLRQALRKLGAQVIARSAEDAA